MNNKFSMNEKAMYLIAAIFILIIMYFRLPPTTFHSEDKAEEYTLPDSQASLSIKKGSGTHEYGWIYLSSSDDLEISISLCEQQVEKSEGKFFPMRLERGGKIKDLSCREFYERLFGEGK